MQNNLLADTLIKILASTDSLVVLVLSVVVYYLCLPVLVWSWERYKKRVERLDEIELQREQLRLSFERALQEKIRNGGDDDDEQGRREGAA